MATARVQPADAPLIFTGKHATLKPVRRQRLEVVQLLDVAVADLAARLVALPDQLGIPGLGVFLGRVDERRVPRPGVGAGDLHAARGEIERRLAAHAAASRHVVGLAVARAGRCVDHHDLERLQRVADALQLRLHVGGGGDVAVREVAEVELHARLEAPLQRHLVDGDGALAAVHGGGEVPGRIEVRAVVGGDIDALHGPALAVRQLGRRQAGEERAHLRRALLVVDVGDLGLVAGRVRRDVALQRRPRCR